jgi:hypothetical protein
MTTSPISRLVLGLVALSGLPGCPSDGEGNPKQLWLALDGSETRVKLIEAEPRPF